MNALNPTALHVYDAPLGRAAAWVICPRRNTKIPVLLCEACPHCACVKRDVDDAVTAIVCVAE